MTYVSSNLEGLIDFLRVQIGDTGTTPIYSDETLHNILRHATKSLMTRWQDKYYLTVGGVVTRATDYTFEFVSPPVIQYKDERAIVLQASIMIKGGKKFSESGNTVNWRDDEISYSNLEGAKQLGSSLDDDVRELNELFPVKLARAKSGRLFG